MSAAVRAAWLVALPLAAGLVHVAALTAGTAAHVAVDRLMAAIGLRGGLRDGGAGRR